MSVTGTDRSSPGSLVETAPAIDAVSGVSARPVVPGQQAGAEVAQPGRRRGRRGSQLHRAALLDDGGVEVVGVPVEGLPPEQGAAETAGTDGSVAASGRRLQCGPRGCDGVLDQGTVRSLVEPGHRDPCPRQPRGRKVICCDRVDAPPGLVNGLPGRMVRRSEIVLVAGARVVPVQQIPGQVDQAPGPRGVPGVGVLHRPAGQVDGQVEVLHVPCEVVALRMRR